MTEDWPEPDIEARKDSLELLWQVVDSLREQGEESRAGTVERCLSAFESLL